MTDERDTLPPAPESHPDPMLSEASFKRILREMVVDELMGLREDVRQMRAELLRLQHRVSGHDYKIEDLEASIRRLQTKVSLLEEALAAR